MMNGKSVRRILWLLGILLSITVARAQMPEWIWTDTKGAPAATNEVQYFRKTFTLEAKPTTAMLAYAADDQAEIYLNGKKVAEISGWTGTYTNIDGLLKKGENVIAIRGTNSTGPAGVIAYIKVALPKRKTDMIITDGSWLSSDKVTNGWTNLDYSTAGWSKAHSLGKVGMQPWGAVFAPPKATPAEELKVLPGFKVKLLRSAQPWEGSWVCMTIDPKGRLIISPQYGEGNMLRITLSPQGEITKMETIDLPVSSAMGLLYAFDYLYVNGNGPEGLGLYRLHCNPRTDEYDTYSFLKKIDGAAGEHGSHAVVLGPEKHIYIVSGNFTKVPTDIAADSPHKNYAEDQLLPRAEDGNGFGVGIKPPGGFLLQTDKDGKEWKLIAAGMRNTYDFAFSPQGEMFGFDSDMEWDWGMPWYRPIRIFQLIPGGDYGFREGSGKWPKYFPDSLPSTVDVGVGSPTGVKFGTDSNFPAKYKKAMFALDWSYGRIFAVHLTPNGAGYNASFETFLKGKPLNLTDIEFGKDGAMYFITGGRGTQSGLYRVTYDGPEYAEDDTAPTRKEIKAGEKARKLRDELESYEGKPSPNVNKAIKFIWPNLNSDDRFISYSARIALESQPVADWQNLALNEKKTNGALTALLALARVGPKQDQDALLWALAKFSYNDLTETQKLEWLRVTELSFIRQGKPSTNMAQLVIDQINPHYPAIDERENQELCQLLIYLQAPGVVTKTLALLDAAPTQEEQVFYIANLRNLTNGWTFDQRKHYFTWFKQDRDVKMSEPTYHQGAGYYPRSGRKGEVPKSSPELLKWFNDAGREYGDGSSFPKFLATFKKDAIATLTAQEKTNLGDLLIDKKPVRKQQLLSKRKYVKEWTVADLLPLMNEVDKGRSFTNGQAMFTDAQCIQCHRFANDGGSVGPELTAVSSRFSKRDILESIIEPSKVVSEQYQNTIVVKKDGDDAVGRLVEDTDKKVVIMTDPIDEVKVEILKADIERRTASKVSPMPEGLMNTLSQNDILDLIAYLESGGKNDPAVFTADKAIKQAALSKP